ncbi:MAG TPA: hypothetical protein VL326_29285 [Kofleriaceae bacterium]|jgi:hypothetical protein|nr:hypothetical protein [Kofleriaceae bacterium]
MRILVIAVVLALAGRAYAYPQFQPGSDVTCTGCHISPDGAGLLNENGLGVLDGLAWKQWNDAFMYGKVPTPDWLQLGGDFRGVAGLFYQHELAAGAFPMQGEIQARAAKDAFSAYLNVGFRGYNENATPFHVVWPREHYLMWQQHPLENYGFYVRAGHLMPTYGLRLAEHVVYTQRFGGKPLFHEVYALAGSWVSPTFEVHASGFIHDPYGDPAERGNGAALYAEARVGTHAAIGTEGKFTIEDDETSRFTGLTAKLYLEGIDMTLLGEGELIQRTLKPFAGDTVNQIAGYVMASKPLPKNLQLDVGVGHFTQDTRVKGLYRDCIDANLHFYAATHVEFLLTTRLELLDGGSGPTGGYALTQLHYRL